MIVFRASTKLCVPDSVSIGQIYELRKCRRYFTLVVDKPASWMAPKKVKIQYNEYKLNSPRLISASTAVEESTDWCKFDCICIPLLYKAGYRVENNESMQLILRICLFLQQNHDVQIAQKENLVTFMYIVCDTLITATAVCPGFKNHMPVSVPIWCMWCLMIVIDRYARSL